MRRTAEIEELIEDLRELAEISADQLNEDRRVNGDDPDFLRKIAGIGEAIPDEMTEAEAAATLRIYFDALVQIADGARDPLSIAEAALAFEPEGSRIINGQKF